jgi:gamma-glutamylcyclotransferase (GGCT)/AIG2-like uncharacterized protein YtfP
MEMGWLATGKRPQDSRVTDCVFVYGTLRRGFASHGLICRLGGSYVGRGMIQGELYDLGSFPGALRSEDPAARVAGEVYRFKDSVRALRTLDEYEGVSEYRAGPYVRSVLEVTLEDGAEVKAWAYCLRRQPDPARRIVSGDYAKR